MNTMLCSIMNTCNLEIYSRHTGNCRTWAAAQIDFLHLKFIVDASRLAYWLGKPVDVSR